MVLWNQGSIELKQIWWLGILTWLSHRVGFLQSEGVRCGSRKYLRDQSGSDYLEGVSGHSFLLRGAGPPFQKLKFLFVK